MNPEDELAVYTVQCKHCGKTETFKDETEPDCWWQADFVGWQDDGTICPCCWYRYYEHEPEQNVIASLSLLRLSH